MTEEIRKFKLVVVVPVSGPEPILNLDPSPLSGSGLGDIVSL
jgi:hypothetical protein